MRQPEDGPIPLLIGNEDDHDIGDSILKLVFNKYTYIPMWLVSGLAIIAGNDSIKSFLTSELYVNSPVMQDLFVVGSALLAYPIFSGLLAIGDIMHQDGEHYDGQEHIHIEGVVKAGINMGILGINYALNTLYHVLHPEN